MRTEILMAGSGGRGVILSGAVLARAAAKAGLNAAYGAIYGAEVRGGLTAAEVVISDQPIDFPFPETPDISFVFDQKSYEKYVVGHEPRKLLILDGDFITTSANVPVPVLRFPFTVISSDEIGNPVVANVVVFGFVAGLLGIIGPQHGESALREEIPGKHLEMNIRAFTLGYERARDHAQYWSARH